MAITFSENLYFLLLFLSLEGLFFKFRRLAIYFFPLETPPFFPMVTLSPPSFLMSAKSINWDPSNILVVVVSYSSSLLLDSSPVDMSYSFHLDPFSVSLRNQKRVPFHTLHSPRNPPFPPGSRE